MNEILRKRKENDLNEFRKEIEKLEKEFKANEAMPEEKKYCDSPQCQELVGICNFLNEDKSNKSAPCFGVCKAKDT